MSAKPLAHIRIFYLEDDFYLAEDTRVTLAEAGAEVVLCGSVQRAFDLLWNSAFDVALLDIDLGGWSSIPVARTLRQDAVPIVFLTSYTREILPQDLVSCPLLTKPAEGTRIVHALGRQLQSPGRNDGIIC